ncbi:hypothetical protein BDV11DRAFT_195191 [Aspergillus similis]
MSVSTRDGDLAGLDRANNGEVQGIPDDGRYTLSTTGDPPRPRYRHRRPRATRSTSPYQSFRRIPRNRTGETIHVSIGPRYESGNSDYSDSDYSYELRERRRHRERYNSSDEDWGDWTTRPYPDELRVDRELRRNHRPRRAQPVLAERKISSKGFRLISLTTSDGESVKGNPPQNADRRRPQHERNWSQLGYKGTQQPRPGAAEEEILKLKFQTLRAWIELLEPQDLQTKFRSKVQHELSSLTNEVKGLVRQGRTHERPVSELEAVELEMTPPY